MRSLPSLMSVHAVSVGLPAIGERPRIYWMRAIGGFSSSVVVAEAVIGVERVHCAPKLLQRTPSEIMGRGAAI